MECVYKGNTAIITFTKLEEELIAWISSTYSNNELNLVISNFLTQKASQRDETLKNEMWSNLKGNPDLIQGLKTELAKRVKK